MRQAKLIFSSADLDRWPRAAGVQNVVPHKQNPLVERRSYERVEQIVSGARTASGDVTPQHDVTARLLASLLPVATPAE